MVLPRGSATVARSQTAQTLEDVIALKKKYGQPILVEIEVERLLETSGKAHAVTQNPRASMIGAPIAKFGARKSRKSSAISSLAVFHLIRWFPWNRRTTDTSVLGERSAPTLAIIRSLTQEWPAPLLRQVSVYLFFAVSSTSLCKRK